MHWHGYAFAAHKIGSGNNEAQRSPEGGSVFTNSPTPPYLTAWWLLKSPKFIVETWNKSKDAVAWLDGAFREANAANLDEQFLKFRVEHSSGSIAHGFDVVWDCWLPDGKFACWNVIACTPNYHDAKIPCPQGKS